MEQIITQIYKSPFGELILGSYKSQLVLCDWLYRKMRTQIDARICKSLQTSMIKGASETNNLAINQLQEYFGGQRKSFDLPLLLAGTDFQKSVWHALINIPYGTTSSYLGLSQSLGNTLAIRAVASANGANAISIIVPCHRIIGSKNELIGYAGGLATKQKLLELENPDFGKSDIAQLTLNF